MLYSVELPYFIVDASCESLDREIKAESVLIDRLNTKYLLEAVKIIASFSFIFVAWCLLAWLQYA